METAVCAREGIVFCGRCMRGGGGVVRQRVAAGGGRRQLMWIGTVESTWVPRWLPRQWLTWVDKKIM